MDPPRFLPVIRFLPELKWSEARLGPAPSCINQNVHAELVTLNRYHRAACRTSGKCPADGLEASRRYTMWRSEFRHYDKFFPALGHRMITCAREISMYNILTFPLHSRHRADTPTRSLLPTQRAHDTPRARDEHSRVCTVAPVMSIPAVGELERRIWGNKNGLDSIIMMFKRST